LVEASDTAVAMTPAQRDRAYRAACEEGLRLADGDQYGLALAAFERALALEPSSTDALFNLGACYEAVGDPLRAVQIYRRVLEMNTEDADCYTNLGTSFIKLYYRDKSPAWRKMARDAWQHSLAIKPDQPQVREYLARSDSLD
jgi:Flp pilus assembly protein TadD